MVATRSGQSSTKIDTGRNVTPRTQLGVCRLVLATIIKTLHRNHLHKTMQQLGLEKYEHRIKYQINYYNANKSWDTTKRKIRKMQSACRKDIVAAYNSLPFPVKLKQLQAKLRANGRIIKRYRLIQYALQMGMIAKTTKKVVNASTPEKCAQRVEDAIAMEEILYREITTSYDPLTPHHRWFYYDQTNANQYVLTDDVVLVPPGLTVYETGRSSLRSTGVTVHAICDQYGDIHYYKVTAGGTKTDDVLEFLNEAADEMNLPKDGTPSVLFLDHLQQHITIQQHAALTGAFPWELHLTPLSCPECSVIEPVFGSFKAYLRKVVIKLKKTLNKDAWLRKVDEEFGRWSNHTKGDMGMLEHTAEYLVMLKQLGGDLQGIALHKAGFKSKDEIKMSLLDQDQ